MIKPWEQLSHEVKFRNPYWEYHLDRVRIPNGREGEYHYMVNRDAIGAFVQLPDKRFAMLREYRYTVNRVSLSHVQGGCEVGETPEDTARREIVEEVGYDVGEIVHLGRFATAPAFSAEEVDVFLATNCTASSKRPPENELEITEVIVMTEQEIDDAIARGEIWDGQVITPWFLVKQHLARG